MDIKNKVALITGGASGLGFASAQKLIAAGAKIMVMDLNEDNAKKACSELDGETDYAVANVAEEASVQEAINKTMDKFGKIDIVLNCAGIGSASKTVGKDFQLFAWPVMHIPQDFPISLEIESSRSKVFLLHREP